MGWGKLAFSCSKLILLLTLVVLLGVGLVYALSYGVKSRNSTQTLSQTVEGVNTQLGLKLSLTLEKTEYTLGEPINMTLTIANIRNQSVTFAYFYNWWDFLVYNVTSYGQNVLYIGDGGHMMLPHGGDVSLDPGMNVTEVFAWQQNCNATLSRYGQPIAPVSSGTYYMVGLYDFFNRDFDYNLRTTPLQITIAPP
jgi:hypothetical protein